MKKIKTAFRKIANPVASLAVWLKTNIDPADIILAASVAAFIIGLSMVYSPLGLILPAGIYLAWWFAMERTKRSGR